MARRLAVAGNGDAIDQLVVGRSAVEARRDGCFNRLRRGPPDTLSAIARRAARPAVLADAQFMLQIFMPASSRLIPSDAPRRRLRTGP
jgi:hypothetical protein